MKCHICGERDATVHYIEIIDGHKTTQWLCQDCADREGITRGDVTELGHGALDAFLGEMLKTGPQAKPRERGAGGPACPACGYEYHRLQDTGMLGCPECYRAFHHQLLPMLRRYHGDTTHVGKLPRAHGPLAALRREIAQLKGLLEQAVAQESYEEAARLRDEIRLREKQAELAGRGAGPAAGPAPDAGPGEPGPTAGEGA